MATCAHSSLWAERLARGAGSDLVGPACLLELAIRGRCRFRLGPDGLVRVARTRPAPVEDGHGHAVLDRFVPPGHRGEVELPGVDARAAVDRSRRAAEAELIAEGYLDPDALKAPGRLRRVALVWLVLFVGLAATVPPTWLWAFMAVFGSAGLFVLGSAVSPSVLTPRGTALLSEMERLAAPPGTGRSVAELEAVLPLAMVTSREPDEWLQAFARRVDAAGQPLTWFEHPQAMGAQEALPALVSTLSASLGSPLPRARMPGAAAVA